MATPGVAATASIRSGLAIGESTGKMSDPRFGVSFYEEVTVASVAGRREAAENPVGSLRDPLSRGSLLCSSRPGTFLFGDGDRLSRSAFSEDSRFSASINVYDSRSNGILDHSSCPDSRVHFTGGYNRNKPQTRWQWHRIARVAVGGPTLCGPTVGVRQAEPVTSQRAFRPQHI